MSSKVLQAPSRANMQHEGLKFTQKKKRSGKETTISSHVAGRNVSSFQWFDAILDLVLEHLENKSNTLSFVI